MVLPGVVDDVVSSADDVSVPDEIKEIAGVKGISFVLALYMLGFGSYMGF